MKQGMESGKVGQQFLHARRCRFEPGFSVVIQPGTKKSLIGSWVIGAAEDGVRNDGVGGNGARRTVEVGLFKLRELGVADRRVDRSSRARSP